MIYKFVTQFLHKYYPKIKEDCLLTKEYSDMLLNYLYSKYSPEEVEESQDEIKQAFSDYLRPYGEAIFSFTPRNGISCYLEPYEVEPKKSPDFTKIVEIIRSHLDQIEYPYNDKVDQIHIPQKLFYKIKKIIIDNREKVNKNALLTLTIQEALQLSPQAVVTPLKDHCIVKIFQKFELFSSKTESTPKSINKSEQRFNGFDEEELKEHYKLIFSEIISINDFLELVMVDVLNNELDFHYITNEQYERNALTIIKRTIAKKLSQFINNNEEYLDGLAGYIFRLSFMKIHKKMALHLLKKLFVKDLKVLNFLEYYNKKSISLGSKFYRVPTITNKNGDLWHITAIISISGLWLKPYLKYEELENDYKRLLNLDRQELTVIELLDEKLKPLTDEVISMSNTLKRVTTFMASYDNKIESLKTKEEINNFRDLNLSQYSTYKEQYDKYIPIYREKLPKLKKMRRKRDLHERNREQHKVAIKQYKIDLKQLKRNFLVHQSSFDEILEAVANALMKRKKLIKG